MGTVYRAFDLRLERPVAIKMLHRVLTTELGVKRFRSEVRIAASLRRPNIVRLHEYDKAADRFFCVMELLAAETLRASSRTRRTSSATIGDAVVSDL